MPPIGYKTLKNKIMKTDNSLDMNFTMLAMVIVKMTSAIEKDTPKDFDDFFLIKTYRL